MFTHPPLCLFTDTKLLFIHICGASASPLCAMCCASVRHTFHLCGTLPTAMCSYIGIGLVAIQLDSKHMVHVYIVGYVFLWPEVQ